MSRVASVVFLLVAWSFAAGCLRFGLDPIETERDARDDGSDARADVDVDVDVDVDGGSDADAGADADSDADSDADVEIDDVPPVLCDWTGPGWTLSPPQIVFELNSPDAELRPMLSYDGLSVFFASKRPGGLGGFDLYVATRPNRSSPFEGIEPISGVNSEADETAIALSRDSLTAIVATDGRPGGRGHDFWVFDRARVDEAFGDGRTLDAVSTEFEDWDPFLSYDGLRLYGASTEASGYGSLWVATRADERSAFGARIWLRQLGRDTSPEGNPSLTFDDRVLVFNVNDSGSTIRFATRSDPDADFEEVGIVPGLLGDGFDWEPQISRDGCELLFVRSPRGSADATAAIYRATFVPQ